MDDERHLRHSPIPLQDVVRGHNLESVLARREVGVGSLKNACTVRSTVLPTGKDTNPVFIDTFQSVAVVSTLTVQIVQGGKLKGKEVLVVIQFYILRVRGRLGKNDTVAILFACIYFFAV